MGKFAKIYLFVIFLFFLVFIGIVFQTFRPVRNVNPNDVVKITGVVSKIEEGPGFDILITLQDDPHAYYINRGLQYDLELDDLKSDILNKTVILYVVKRWTIFTRDGIMGHISKLKRGNQVLFNEIKNDTDEQTIQ